ncbi:MAG: HAMP domain-containing protein [Lachnospiraceae bacterium]|jgi:sensor histidine kinase YesM|nr:HAMP domain-containing protein [Lachnospiraceae bacterium]
MRYSIFKRTLIIIVLTFFTGFSILFTYQFKEAVDTINTQILNNSLDNLSMIESYLKIIIERQVNFISQLTQNKMLKSLNEEKINDLFQAYPTTYTNIDSFMLIKNDEIIAINNNMLIANRTIDTSIYYEMRQKNRLIVTPPYYSTILANRSIAIISSITDEESQELLLIAEIRPQTLFNFLSLKISNSETLVVLNNSGESVYFDGKSDLIGNLSNTNGQLDISDNLKKQLLQVKSNISEIRIDNKKLIIRRIRYNNQWNLYFMTDYSYYYRTLYKMIKNYSIIGILSILLIIPISLIISMQIIKPIKKLTKQIKQTTPDIPVPKLETNKITEINHLAVSFNNLLDNLQAAAEQKSQMQKKQFEYEYKVLQSQIQPHFLFNIHICIHALLEQNKIEDAKKMLHSFDTLLRTITYKMGETIKLEEEMIIVQEYTRLQRFRLGDTFDLILDDYEQFKDVNIPKLLLQPIIENSIYHGFQKLSRRGEIHIKFDQLDNELHIFIEDNGIGIPANVLKTIWTSREERTPNHQGMVSIGLLNVKERIRHFYGKECDMYINSREGIGTIVEIVIRIV